MGAETNWEAALGGMKEDIMESLGDILRRITARDTLKGTNGDNAGLRSIVPEEPSGEICQICNGAGWVSKRVPVSHPDFGEAFPCRCQQENRIDRADALHRYSNLGALSRITLENTLPESPFPDATGRQSFRDALAAATDFAENPSGWLVFTGPSGSGKTHLAVAAANRCIELGYTTYFIAVADLLDHLRATYSPDNPVSYDELFEQVRNVPVLVLDDLTAQATTPWAQEKLFQIFSHRFNEEMPTIITVRGAIDRLDDGLLTRIESYGGFSRIFRLRNHNSRQARRVGYISDDMQRRMTLETFNVQGSTRATRDDRASLVQAKQEATAFAANPEGWLLFTGDRGCGKTHLAVAVAGENIRQGRPVFYTFVPSLLDHLRATFSPDSPIGYDELFEQVKTAPLLILDDLGTEMSTPWADEKLYQLVVYRYDTRLPTVITTVITLDHSMDDFVESWPGIGSRLVDSTVVKWCPITAPNYRDQRRGR